MRKAETVFLAAVLTGLMSMTAPGEQQVMEFNRAGVDFTFPEETQEIEGYLEGETIGPLDESHHVYGAAVAYFAMPEDEVTEAMNDPELTEERYDEIMACYTILDLVLATDSDQDTVKTAVEDYGFSMNTDALEEIGAAEGHTFYLLPGVSDAYYESIGEPYASECRKLAEVMSETLKNARFYAPLDPDKEMVGKKLEFDTIDLDGNEVSSRDLFAENEITMVNCWGTWCPNCMMEMEELARLHKEFQEMGCGIVGLDYEGATDEKTRAHAKEVLEEYGITYPNVMIPDEVRKKVTGYPTTYFVDKEGNVLTMPIAGAYVDRYKPRMEALMNKENSVSGQTEEDLQTRSDSGNPAAADAYQIYVRDEDGPVEGVTLQVCDDATCNLGETGADGCARFELPPGKEYEVHVLVLPDGYQEDENIYHTPEEYGDLTIELKKAA